VASVAGGDIKYDDFFGQPDHRGGRKQQEDYVQQEDGIGMKAGAPDVETSSGTGTEAEENETDEGSDVPIEDDGAMKPPKRKTSKLTTEEHDGAEEVVLSTHEKRQLRVAKEIEKVEELLMADKAWQFRGEATAKQRPKDSALEIDLV
jgi:U3 small nucleolar RNA-associated protein MPP10